MLLHRWRGGRAFREGMCHFASFLDCRVLARERLANRLAVAEPESPALWHYVKSASVHDGCKTAGRGPDHL